MDAYWMQVQKAVAILKPYHQTLFFQVSFPRAEVTPSLSCLATGNRYLH